MQTFISKEQSAHIKGIAILMMVWLHLFQGGSNYASLFSLYGMTVERVLTLGCHPVPFFLIVSGYGQSFSLEHHGLDTTMQMKKILKLYICYWLVAVVLVSIGSVLYPEKYPGDALAVLLNMTGVKCTWSYEMWFLFPFAVVTIFAKKILHIAHKWGMKVSVLLSFLVQLCCGFVISRSVSRGYDLRVLSTFLVCLEFIFPFLLGAFLYDMRRKSFLPDIPSWLLILSGGGNICSQVLCHDTGV